jgi:adenylyltransferase/sulfurtransferase
MLTAEARDRYLRHILLKEIGAQGQQKLLAAHILVVGAGGLGNPVIQYLAAAGVGHIALADDDAVSLANLQRQTVFRDEDVGAPKVERAADFIGALNPDVEVEVIRLKVTDENAAAIVANRDLIIEGVDSFEARFALNRAAIGVRTPLLSAAIGRFEGQAALFKPWAGPELPCYRCLVPQAPPRDAVLTCAEEGVAGPLAGILGSFLALEALKELLGFGETLAGRLFLFDGLSGTSRTVRLPRDPECPDCGSIARGVG